MTKNDGSLVIKTPKWELCFLGIGIVILGWFVYGIITYSSGTVQAWINVLNFLYLIIMGAWVLLNTIGRKIIFDESNVKITGVPFHSSITIPWNELFELDCRLVNQVGKKIDPIDIDCSISDNSDVRGIFCFRYFKDKEMRKPSEFTLSAATHRKEIEFAIKKLPIDILTDSARAKIYEMGLWVWEEKYETYSSIGRYSDKK